MQTDSNIVIQVVLQTNIYLNISDLGLSACFRAVFAQSIGRLSICERFLFLFLQIK